MISIWIVTSILVVSLAVIIYYVNYERKDLPPGPWGLPFVGYLPFLDAKNPHLTLTSLAEKYGAIYSMRLGHVFAVVLSDVGLIKEALGRNAFNGRAPLYLTHGIMNGNGIISAQGEKWKEQRKFATSNLRCFGMAKFGPNRCKMESDIKNGVTEFTSKLEEVSDAVDPEPILMHALGNVVFNLVFGKTWQENDETWQRLLSYQEEGTKLIGVAGPINFLPFLRFLPKYKKILSYIKNGIIDTHKIYEHILENHRKSMQQSVGEPAHFLAAFDKEMEKRRDSPGYFTLTQFNFLMADLWGAGVDTTITTLRWFFLYMATHDRIQEQVQMEIDQVLGSESLSLSHVTVLPFLQACISETQRIRSVTPLGIPHGALEASFLAGYRIPKGSMIVPLQWAVHMNPRYHRDPEVFNPSRFLEEGGSYGKMEAFIPFQTGKRVCLGEEYAKMLLFLFGGGVLQKFRLSLEGEISLEGNVGITLTPEPHKIRFSLRRRVFRDAAGSLDESTGRIDKLSYA